MDFDFAKNQNSQQLAGKPNAIGWTKNLCGFLTRVPLDERLAAQYVGPIIVYTPPHITTSEL
jgi:hypothetical protein